MANSGFDDNSRCLIADLARRFQPRLNLIASRWADVFTREAFANESSSDGSTPSDLAAEFIVAFFQKLATGDFEGAFELHHSFVEHFVNNHPSRHAANRDVLDQLLASIRALREIVHDEFGLAYQHESESELVARLQCDRLLAAVADGAALIHFHIRDESHSRRQDELTTERDAALMASRLKSAFLADMTHEIRTPLNVILGYADLMAERLSELNDDAGLRFGEPIRRSGRRLLDTIGAILDLSRIESGVYRIQREPLSLAAIIERHVEDLGVLARQKGLDLDCLIEQPDAIVHFDEHCLSHTITNLLQNAIKYTERGGVTVRVFRDHSDELCLQVSDTGIGIDPAYLTHLFEPFSKESDGATGRIEGAGLGLALVKRYVELNGGRIEVESRKSAGTAFTVRFGVVQGNPDDPKIPSVDISTGKG